MTIAVAHANRHRQQLAMQRETWTEFSALEFADLIRIRIRDVINFGLKYATYNNNLNYFAVN